MRRNSSGYLPRFTQEYKVDLLIFPFSSASGTWLIWVSMWQFQNWGFFNFSQILVFLASINNANLGPNSNRAAKIFLSINSVGYKLECCDLENREYSKLFFRV